jgi:hypothetical protein
LELHGNGTIWRDNSTILEPFAALTLAARGLRNTLPGSGGQQVGRGLSGVLYLVIWY